jgi:uncharacterized protein YggU (UPF0235/DUF167 family)
MPLRAKVSFHWMFFSQSCCSCRVVLDAFLSLLVDRVSSLMASRTCPALLQLVSPGVFLLAVRAKPGARSTKVAGPVTMDLPQLEVRVAARPVDGQANSELVDQIESTLQAWVSRSIVTVNKIGTGDQSKERQRDAGRKRVTCELVAGGTSRDKTLRVEFPGSAEQLLAALTDDAE